MVPAPRASDITDPGGEAITTYLTKSAQSLATF